VEEALGTGTRPRRQAFIQTVRGETKSSKPFAGIGIVCRVLDEHLLSERAGDRPMSDREHWLRRVPGDRWATIVPSGMGLDPAVLDLLASTGLGSRAMSSEGRTYGTRPSLVVLNLFSVGDPRARPAVLTQLVRSLLDSPLVGIPLIVIEPGDGDMVGWAAGYDARIVWPTGADGLRSIIRRLICP
jgi:hypothetical protein